MVISYLLYCYYQPISTPFVSMYLQFHTLVREVGLRNVSDPGDCAQV